MTHINLATLTDLSLNAAACMETIPMKILFRIANSMILLFTAWFVAFLLLLQKSINIRMNRVAGISRINPGER